MAFLQGRGQVSMTKPAPNWKWNRLSLAASALALGLQLCSWIAMWEQQSFHGTSLICKSLNRWPATPSKPVSVVHLYNWQVKYSIQHCYEKNVPTGVIFDQIFKFKTLLEASSLEGYFSFEHQTWNDGMTDVHRPPTLTLRSQTGAAKPTLWPTLNPCHFTVPCFIYKTKTVSFSSKQALSNNVFGVKIGRTTTLRRLFKVINFRRSKFVCTLWPGPVFGMCAAGLATHLTTPVCPVARTQTIILQVVYWAESVSTLLKNGAIVRSLGDTGTKMAQSLCLDFKLSNEGSFVEIGQEMTKLGWKVGKKSLQSLLAELQSLRTESIAVCMQRWSFRRRSLSWETSFDWSEMKVRALPGVSPHPAVRTWPGFQIKWTQLDFSWFFMRTIPAAENRGVSKWLIRLLSKEAKFTFKAGPFWGYSGHISW